MLTASDWPHHDCLFDYFAIRNGCVSTQRLHHCVSAWPHGQTLILTLGSLTARVARRAAICHLHFSLALRPSMISILRPAHRPRCAARQHASSIVITMLSLCGWPRLNCFQATLLSAMAVCPQRLCRSHSSLASQPSALSIIWTAYRPHCAACSDLPIAF